MAVLRSLLPYLKTAAFVAAATALAGVVVWFAPLDSVSAIYMLPVLIAAVRYGTGPAVVAALLGALMTTLFYPPLFSVLVFEPPQIIDLITSLVVALVVGQLAGKLRQQMVQAREGEQTIRRIYELSSALATATDVDSVYRIVAEQLSQALGRPAALFARAELGQLATVHSPFSREVTDALAERARLTLLSSAAPSAASTFALPQNGHWLLCRLTGTDEARAIVAIELDTADGTPHETLMERIRLVLAEGNRSLERLGLSQILEERRLRQRTDALRDILVESVSHELRTPLAGIMGSASVLAASPRLEDQPALLALAGGVEHEAARLDRLIQNVLDLGRIRAGALQPRLDAVDPLDIINNALDVAAVRLSGHAVRRDFGAELPFVRVDPMLVSQALVNVLENAAKYTPEGGAISVSASMEGDAVAVAIHDEGAGLAAGEADMIFERFHRGERHADIAGGSGLGLTIARVFVEACGGHIAAASDGSGLGTTLRLVLPMAKTGRHDLDDE
ncbi:DUF4118 domain-containing protein [Bosea sp. F3-2]|uniref:sensor histidine kinase n=1 Tax=Bosea sp. F3-2 TaxID=2599640 RepID=UPI0011F0252D|nr:ATP-binding protein [Bosea sp. F3-2]QEL21135.1 DUF4118 domain-containing protein [Bosea sp. F3-2]